MSVGSCGVWAEWGLPFTLACAVLRWRGKVPAPAVLHLLLPSAPGAPRLLAEGEPCWHPLPLLGWCRTTWNGAVLSPLPRRCLFFCRRACLCVPVVFEMSEVLGCGLDRPAVELVMQLVEAGVNPEALAAVVREMRRERDALLSR